MDKILIPLFTGLIGVLIGYRLNLGGNAHLKRKRFKSYIELLSRKVEATLLRDFVYDASGIFRDIPKFESEVLDVRPHIGNNRIVKFDAACAAYKSTRFGNIGTAETNAEAEKTKAKLLALLGDISSLAR